MKIIWTGTDALMLIDISKRKFIKKPYWIMFRILAKMIDFVCQEHLAYTEIQIDQLVKFGMKKPFRIIPNEPAKVIYFKEPHPGFNVLYYFPKNTMELKFRKWLYGYDIFEQMKANHPGLNYIVVNGSQDMSKIYPIIDYCIRPNRNDGNSRMIQECEMSEIPYYYTRKNPSIDEIDKDIMIKQNEDTRNLRRN
jgi:hypothetical protein